MRILTAIVTYNRKATLQKSLLAHLADGAHPEDILVVDNASTDGTGEFLRLNYPTARYSLNSENIGSAGGFAVCMNYALQHGYQYLWLYNDDSRPMPGANQLMKHTLELLAVEDKVGFIKMGMLRNGKSEASFWKGKRVTHWIDKSETPVRSGLITFDGCIINVELIKEIGTCDPIFFMGIYEFDFCLRASDANWKIYTLPAGLIEDEKKGSAKGVPFWRMYYVTRNHLYLALKRKSLMALINFSILEVKKIFSIILFQQDKLKKLRIKFKAIFDAITGKMGKRVAPSV